VRLVTVSFDPGHDTPAIIQEYGARLGAKPDLWTILTPLDPDALQRSLNAFGVVAIPAPQGQFVHNAAFHVIDRHGRLARIIDITQPEAALSAARQIYGAS
jgi:protein SCO1/2